MKTCEKMNLTDKIKSIKPEIRYFFYLDHCFKVPPVEDMFPAEFSESSAELLFEMIPTNIFVVW